MNKIIIDPHYCSEEEYQELKNYLNKKVWDWEEVQCNRHQIIYVNNKNNKKGR